METMFPYRNNFNRAGNSTTKIDENFVNFEVYLGTFPLKHDSYKTRETEVWFFY